MSSASRRSMFATCARASLATASRSRRSPSSCSSRAVRSLAPGRELQLALIQLAAHARRALLIAAAVGGELSLTFVEHLLTRVDLNPSLCRFTLSLGERRFAFRRAPARVTGPAPPWRGLFSSLSVKERINFSWRASVSRRPLETRASDRASSFSFCARSSTFSLSSFAAAARSASAFFSSWTLKLDRPLTLCDPRLVLPERLLQARAGPSSSTSRWVIFRSRFLELRLRSREGAAARRSSAADCSASTARAGPSRPETSTCSVSDGPELLLARERGIQLETQRLDVGSLYPSTAAAIASPGDRGSG